MVLTTAIESKLRKWYQGHRTAVADMITMFCWEIVEDFGILAGNAVECCGGLEDNAESETDVEVAGEVSGRSRDSWGCSCDILNFVS